MASTKSAGAAARKDRHKEHTKSLRLPAGDTLLGWFEDYAAARGMSVNAALVLALREFRAHHEQEPDATRLDDLERQLARLQEQMGALMSERISLLRRHSPLSADFAAKNAELDAQDAALSAQMDPIVAELRAAGRLKDDPAAELRKWKADLADKRDQGMISP
ncbi:MAG: hypothetical protein J2P28_18170, partial [Actinobacteria bacterium]|nr:hypothetical protein [Actinomycetota bacterium]